MESIFERINFILENKLIAIVRADSESSLMKVISTLYRNGLRVIEIAMTTPNALQVINMATKQFKKDSNILLGAGSVLNPEMAKKCILNGAEFIVSPCTNEEVIKLAHQYGIPTIQGAFTPNEILRAWELGADLVKVFPCSILGSEYIKAIKAPLPDIPLVPTGGINLENAVDFLKNGADALGLGSSLVSKKEIINKDFNSIGKKAMKLSAVCKEYIKGI